MERAEYRACRERTPEEDRAVRDAMARRQRIAAACQCDPALYVDPECKADHDAVSALTREYEIGAERLSIWLGRQLGL